MQENHRFLAKLAKLERIEIHESGEAPLAAIQIVNNLEILVPMKGLIDVAAERTRLSREIEKAEKDLRGISGKLGNENFVAKAPEAVVAKERERQASLQESLGKLQEQLGKLDGLD